MTSMSEQARDVVRRLDGVADPAADQLAEAVGVFAPLAWAMHGRWHRDGTLRVLRLAEGGASDLEIDEVLAEMWNTDNRSMLRHAAAPIRTWANVHHPLKQLLWDRVSYLEKAIAHHEAGAYEASIPIVYAQIDGLCFDLTKASFFSKANDDPFIDDQTLAGMETNLPTVREAFSADVAVSGRHGLVSRHGVLHGRDLAYASRINSTKAIVLVGALAEYFPRVADAAGARSRREHEEEVPGATDVDEIGRLMDDREVPQVHDFAWDFDSEYAKSVLTPGAARFNVDDQVDAIACKHGLDPQRITRGCDDVGCWWHYTIPAGQVLGYATRPTTDAKRRHPDVWRSDARRAPEQPPWRSQDGWRSDDQLPRSPNWEPNVVT